MLYPQHAGLDSDLAHADVSAQLARIQASPLFANSTRLCQLLTYLVENSVRGDDRNLLECAIAFEVFDRGEAFDSQSDTIVRVSVRRLRKFLADYYQDQGREDPVRFQIPTGHYRVKFSLQGPSGKSPEPAGADRTWYRPFSGLAGLAMATVLAIAVFGWLAAIAVTPALGPDSTALPKLLLGQQMLHRRGPGDVERAVAQFEQVVAEDAGNLDAWIGLASALRVLDIEDPDTDHNTVPRQYWALHQALTLDPFHPEANARIAGLHAFAGDMAGATRFMSKALEFGRENNLVLSMIAGQERAGGNLRRAIELQRSASSYPPLDLASFANLAYMLYEAGEFYEALEVIDMTESISPLRSDLKGLTVKILIQMGEIAMAEQKLTEIPPGIERQRVLVLLHFASGRDRESQRELEALAGQPPSVDLSISVGEALAFRGEHDEAMDAIEAAFEQIRDRIRHPTQCCQDIQTLLRSPYFESLHEHPRFVAWADRARAFVAEQRPNLLTLAKLEGEATLD